MSDIKNLETRIAQLEELVTRQSNIITKTGEQLLSLQVAQTSAKLAAFNPNSLTGGEVKKTSKFQPTAGPEDEDYATNEDLVQLVGELQGQFDLLEERSIRRLINSTKTSGSNLAPLSNPNGEEPPLDLYPKDIEALKNIDDLSLIKLAKFYELLPPTQEERAKFEEYLEGKTTENPEFQEHEVKVEDYSKEDLIEAFDNLARFLGVSLRRGEDAW
ncbi:hypothetical protein WICPIJ_009789 [Wickerhamomyces pijperi]|uniref:Mrp8p n=1 Tax=Wickerhamomyces pijperi TaxID=599730 RepID=A0A9P8TCM8_WICPI|nr:hypothetical protein WICPIJ_009789 [Wickerhamomyces pijperi]